MPNIAIYEGGKAARMNGVSLITTDDGDGGKIEWVPQSDRQTGSLYVHENGTYRAEDEGLHSWSKVSVRLAGAPAGLSVPTLPDPITLAEIPTGEVGEIEPVAPAGLEPIEDIEPISTEEAESILEDTEFDPSDLDPESPNYEDAIDAIADALGVDPEDVKVIDPEKKEDVKKEQPKVEDKGQQAVGTDPKTGEPATITPSGKEGAVVPNELRIVTPPMKTSYDDGETIDYSGIQCALYKDGKFIRNATFDELSFPVTTAVYDGNRIPYTDDNGLNAVLLTGVFAPHYGYMDYAHQKIYTQPWYITSYVTSVAGRSVGFVCSEPFSLYGTNYDGRSYVKIASGGDGVWGWGYSAPQTEGAAQWGTTIVGTLGKPPASYGPYQEDLSFPESTVDPRLEGSRPIHAAGQKQPVPVNWAGGGTELEASFEIMVHWDDV